jgi:hypothetical protein
MKKVDSIDLLSCGLLLLLSPAVENLLLQIHLALAAFRIDERVGTLAELRIFLGQVVK